MRAEHCGELCRGDTEQWFFFMPRQEREVRGGRPSRTTGSGYWKATGSPSYVYSSDNKVIGVKKSMVFYRGKAPTGRKTKWKMNEYRAIKQDSSTSIPMVCARFLSLLIFLDCNCIDGWFANCSWGMKWACAGFMWYRGVLGHLTDAPLMLHKLLPPWLGQKINEWINQ